MRKPLFDTAGPWAKIVFTAFITAVSFLVFFLLGHLIGGICYGFTEEAFKPEFLTQAENIGRLKLLQAVQSVGLFLVPAWLASELFAKSARNFLGLGYGISALHILLIFVLVISIQPLVNFLGEINHAVEFPANLHKKVVQAEEKAQELTLKILLSDKSWLSFVVNLIIVAVIPSVGEELLFRGLLQRLFYRFSPKGHLAVWVTAILFSAVHFQFFGFLPRLMLGAVFGYLMLFSGNLWLPILAHFFNNAVGVVFYHFYYTENETTAAEQVGTADSLIWLIPSIVFSALIFAIVVKKKGGASPH